MISGFGTISANGGAGEMPFGGGGAGGRIALTTTSNQFSGTASALGGAGFQYGGAGTFYTETAVQTNGLLAVENGSHCGAATVLNLEIQPIAPDVIVGPGALVDLNGPSANLSVRSNGWLVDASQPWDLIVHVHGDAVIEAGGGINSTGQGVGQGPGVGGAFSGGGAGHAGYGGAGTRASSEGGGPPTLSGGGNYYDSVVNPSQAGSQGGSFLTNSGGKGGGYIGLYVSGELVLNGSIVSDGVAPTAAGAGAGSGGSINLAVGILSGSGLLSANGGSAIPPNGGGGSGGRIALSFGSNLLTGTLSARGGTGFGAGAAGTIYLKNTADPIGQVFLDNAGSVGTNSFLSGANNVDLAMRNGAVATLVGQSFRNLIVGSNSYLYPSIYGSGTQIVAIVSGSATVQSGGAISLNGTSSGPGRGLYYATWRSGGGGGHGGYGGNGYSGSYSVPAGGNAHDSTSAPNSPGGAGGDPGTSVAGSGGGALRLVVSNLFTVNGRLSADGSRAYASGAGGGAGGSLYLIAGGLAGAGEITANGGAGDFGNGGGGGGGRIAVYCSSNLFNGTLSASGGSGYVPGGAGTIYLKSDSDSAPLVLVDNGGLVGTNTLIQVSGPWDLRIRGGAWASGLQSFRNLTVGSNSVLTTLIRETWNISGDASIEAGGAITADGKGGPANGGLGAGRYYSMTLSGSGGGHMGYGGDGYPYAGGVVTGDNPAAPFQSAPGGGSYDNTPASDSAGGGCLKLNVTGLLTADGRLSADGTPGRTNGAGGGAGGSLWLTVGGLAGTGIISASGGAGHQGGGVAGGGGGGGGGIAVYYESNLFAGRFAAQGGLGLHAGGAGIVYLRPMSGTNGMMIVGNGGQRGARTLVSSDANSDIIAGSGAALVLPSSAGFTFRNLVLQSNSSVLFSNSGLTVLGDMQIQRGAVITADGLGYTGGNGPGTGSSTNAIRGGGSHGGLGAVAALPTYGSLVTPATSGSGGGNASSPIYLGGPGGGVINLSVGGCLAVDGTVSANGLGGGRVALYLSTNSFTGAISACGGGGAAAGGAGTIYTKITSAPFGQLLVDNANLTGRETPLSLPALLDLTVSGGARAELLSNSVLISNLTIGSSSALVNSKLLTNLDLGVLENAVIQSGGKISVDGQGFGRASGPGAGLSFGGFGSGGGYGGAGGVSVTVLGGATYGAEERPIERGSGGGEGSFPVSGGSEGAGAIKLTVGGGFTLDGMLSANGNWGIQDCSGGGSGGSVWVAASTFNGTGTISAAGGDGESYGGGGGGGGRIAVYTRTNQFSGTLSSPGGEGFEMGSTGTVYCSSAMASPQITEQTPSGAVSNGIPMLTVRFDSPIQPGSFTVEDVQLFTPTGPVLSTNLLVSAADNASFSIRFPPQTTPGLYTVLVGPQIQDVLGLPMSQTYTGSFTIFLPTIQGTITDTNGTPISEVTLAADGPVSPAVSAADGMFTLGAPPGLTFAVVPTKPGWFFIPGSRGYTNVTENISNQDFIAVTSLVGDLQCRFQDTNLFLWTYGHQGVSYQLLSSTNLSQWMGCSSWLQGTNGPLELLVPLDASPKKFFRIQARD